MESGKIRGSDALRAAWRDRGDVLDDGVVEELASHFEEFDALHVAVGGGDRSGSIAGAFSTDDPERCGNTVRELLGLGPRFPVHIRVFPRGTPWPDQFIVEFDAGQAQR